LLGLPPFSRMGGPNPLLLPSTLHVQASMSEDSLQFCSDALPFSLERQRAFLPRH